MTYYNQEICECGNRKFFIFCIADHSEGEVVPHEFMAICSNCGQQRDIDDLLWNHPKKNGEGSNG